jgi:hypothetical protein
MLKAVKNLKNEEVMPLLLWLFGAGVQHFWQLYGMYFLFNCWGMI